MFFSNVVLLFLTSGASWSACLLYFAIFSLMVESFSSIFLFLGAFCPPPISFLTSSLGFLGASIASFSTVSESSSNPRLVAAVRASLTELHLPSVTTSSRTSPRHPRPPWWCCGLPCCAAAWPPPGWCRLASPRLSANFSFFSDFLLLWDG